MTFIWNFKMVGEGGAGGGGNAGGAAGAGSPSGGASAGGSGSPTDGVASGEQSTAPSHGAIQNAKPTAGQSPGEEKTWDVQVQGKMVRMTEGEMREAASLGKTAWRKIEEGAAATKRAEAFWREFQENPMAALDKTNLDPAKKRAMIEKYYKDNYIDRDAMTAEQKELAEAKKWRADREAQDKADAEQQQQEGRKKIEGQWRDHYSKAIMEGLDKNGKLPKTAKTVGRVAFYLQQNAIQKLDQTMDQVVERVRQDYQEEHRAFAGDDTPVEALVELLGPNAVKKLQRYALDQHKKRLEGNMGGVPPIDPPARTATAPKEKARDGGNGWGKVTNYWTRRDK